MTTNTEWHAIKTQNGGKHFFEFNGESFFNSREELEASISAWRSMVTPRMADATTFEIHATK